MAMLNNIKLYHSASPGAVPASLIEGHPAFNHADRKVFIRGADGNVEVLAQWVATGGINAVQLESQTLAQVRANIDAVKLAGQTLAQVRANIDYGSLSNVPSAFPPIAHSHPISGVDGLQDALDLKATTAALNLKADQSAVDLKADQSFANTLAPKADPTFTGTANFTGTATFAARPTFNGNTPYDSGNFDPTTKLDVSSFTWANLPGRPTNLAYLSRTSTTSSLSLNNTAGVSVASIFADATHFAVSDKDGVELLNVGLSSNALSYRGATVYTTANLPAFALDNAVVKTTGTQTIAGNKTFTGNTTFAGDVYITGTTTSVNTSELEVADPIITLGKNNTGGALSYLGVKMERGTNDAYMAWRESDASFLFGVATDDTLAGFNARPIRALSFDSTVTTGTAPLTVSSTTQVNNLNAQYVGGADLTSLRDFGQLQNRPTNYPTNIAGVSGLSTSLSTLQTNIDAITWNTLSGKPATLMRTDVVNVITGGVSGSEGGEIQLAKPSSGTQITNNIAIDIAGDNFRIYETGGAGRGAFLSIPLLSGGVASRIWTSADFTLTTFADRTHGHAIADVSGLQGALNTLTSDKANVSGQTFTGNVTAPLITAGGSFIDGPASTDRGLVYRTNGSVRWRVAANGVAESGSDTGSNFTIDRYNDAGARIGTAFSLERNTGNAVFSGAGRFMGTLGIQNLLNIIGNAGTDRIITFYTGSTSRWSMMAQAGAETGANGGSDFWLTNYNDNGTYKGSALEIRRSDNRALFNGPVQVQNLLINTTFFYADGNNGVIRTGAPGNERYFSFDASNGYFNVLNGGVISSGAIYSRSSLNVEPIGTPGTLTQINPGWMELRNNSNGYGPYIDLSADSSADYHARMSWAGRFDLISTQALHLTAAGDNNHVRAYSGTGKQSGDVLTENGTEQTLAKQVTFPSTQNPQDAGAGAFLEVRGAGGGYGAWMKFHRPGAYGTYFGMFDAGRWGFGGWSAGAQIYEFWTSNNFDPLSRLERFCDGWVQSRDNKDRFYFATNGRTYYKSPNGHELRNSADIWSFILQDDHFAQFRGQIYTEGNYLTIRGGSPTIVLRDTDHRSAMIHVNNNTFYILRGSGTDSDGWTSYGDGWPFQINLENNDAYFGGQVYGGNNCWFRVRGNGGYYFESYGGGIYMTDTSWLRINNEKNFVTNGTIQMGAFTVSSDRRLKTFIEPIPLDHASRILDGTNVYEFTKGGRRMFGMIAQEAREIAPILVSEGADKHEDGTAILTLDQTGYIPLLVKEVQSLRRRVAQLELAA